MSEANPFELREDPGSRIDPEAHVFGHGHVCRTEQRGKTMPQGRSLFEIVVDASNGFVPLWAPNVLLRYRFDDRSFRRFRDPDAAKARVRELFGQALLLWGDAAPVRFGERRTGTDFEITIRNADDCDATGCVLASAFFPDAGRHQLRIYPKLFSQPVSEQVETLVHEIGHIFGLRHFFAQVSETEWASQIFGVHSKFSVMNYGADSVLTDADRADLKLLYEQVWNGTLKNINGTPIQLVKPYSALLA